MTINCQASILPSAGQENNIAEQKQQQQQIRGLTFHLSFVYKVTRADLPKVCKYKNSRNIHRFKVIPFKFKELFEQVINMQIQEFHEYPEIEIPNKFKVS